MSRRTNLKNWLVIIALLLAAQYSVGLQVWAGSVISWGEIAFNGSDFIGGSFVIITAGTYHNLALKSDGSIVGWGDNEYGQADPPDGNDFVGVAAGRRYSLALKSDGSIIAWGYNEYGQADAPDGNDFVAVAAGLQHSLALKSNGSIVGWGRNRHGQADPPAGSDFVAVAAGYPTATILSPSPRARRTVLR
ncbi:MAG: RCC1 domain-containing protein [Planctomycetota bacterium]|jgi:alpha-tubulin suppressor-like RCC1 family protein